MRYSILLILLLTFCNGCRKSDQNWLLNDPSSLKIDAGFACGWGTGADSLIITRSLIKYLYWIPSESLSPKINKTRSVSDTEWTAIVKSVNLTDFMKLNYNSCDICVDGCDEWIGIQTDHISHLIRFPKGLKIDSIQALQEKLAELRSEFSR